MPYRELTIHEWNQFYPTTMQFHRSATILTGENGAGKTTLLRLLATHAGWDFPNFRVEDESSAADFVNDARGPVAQIQYSQGGEASFYAADDRKSKRSNENHLIVRGKQNARTIFVPQSRIPLPYGTTSFPELGRFDEVAALEDVVKALKDIAWGKPTQNPMARIFGYLQGTGNEQPVAIRKFNSLLHDLLPDAFGFSHFGGQGAFGLITREGKNFPVQTLSAGVSSMVLIAWIATLLSKTSPGACLLIDEPENHLHPEMQRGFIDTLVRHCPNLQFVIATHSPLLANGHKDSQIYAFSRQQGRFVVEQLQDLVKAGTAESFLSAMGVEFPGPPWVEQALNEAYQQFARDRISAESIEEFENSLMAQGLGDFVPKSILKAIRSEAG